MTRRSYFKIVSLAITLGLFAATPIAISADGYTPLNLPERGAGPSGVQGESTSSATPSASPSALPTSSEADNNITSGTVERVEDGRLVVSVDGEERDVEIPDDVQVTRDGQDINLDDIQSGDTASFERNEQGEITEVRVASQQSMNFWRGFLPILLVVLVGFYLLSRRAKRNA